ncbi:MAG: GMC family oxidoreductase [Longimicrobiales bacterium]
MQVQPQRKLHDIAIVGSGAGGGMAAWVLANAGADVVMLEAGPEWYADQDGAMLTWPYETALRGAATDEKPFGEFDGCIGGWEIEGEPYTRADGTRFDWWRARMLGGRTNHWGRISLRFGPDDFRGKSRDGLGDDWPITYDDVARYYDRIDRLIGIFGSAEGLPNHPDSIFQPPPAPRCYERLVKRACDRLEITCVAGRLSVITQPLNGRPACHYCGQCNRGCGVNANFSSPMVLIRPALETGNLTLITNAMAREVTTGRDGRATGVSYVDKSTGADEHVRARVVVLAASACESARILLNSTSSRFPQGLANSSGTVGKYLTDTTGTDAWAHIPALVDSPPHNEDGVGGGHIYVPWWLDNASLDFPRGYHLEVWGGRDAPAYGFMGGIHRYNASGGGYGAQLKQDYRRYWGSVVGLSGRGEMIPNDDSYCELDPNVVDRWGIPVLRFHWRWSENELLQVRHMQQSARAILEQMGGKMLSDEHTEEDGWGIIDGGRIIHELGCVRMGDDPSTSVLDPYCRAHDVPNLFVADGGPFVSQADKNPTWTILALAWRTADQIARLRSEGVV